MNEIKYIGQLSSSQNSRVIDTEGICYAMTNGEKDGTPKIIKPLSCAMRGRNPENPSERGRSNGKYKQRIEMGNNISNTITSVQKDALVAEPNIWKKVSDELKQIATQARGEQIEVTISEKGSLRPHRMDKAKSGCSEFQVEHENDTASTLISARPNMTYGATTSFRIRKLTERECFRLMGVSETDIDKIQQSGVSRTQQYKMAGNSIVVDVLYHIFRKLFVDTGQESQQLSLF